MPGPTLEEVKESVFAELGRQRQDELPLGRWSKKPSFLPERIRGTDRIPQARKERLESKWDVKIVDEESEQMEGLEIGNSRPWAKITHQYMARFAVESAPPRLAIGVNQTRTIATPKAPSSIISSRDASSVLLRTLPHVSNQKAIPQQQTQVRPGAMAIQNTRSPAPPGIKAQEKSAKMPTKSSSGQSLPKPEPSIPRHIQEHILSQGACEIVNEPENSSFAAEYIIKVHLQKNEGLLMFVSPNKSQVVHNVLSLDAPVTKGPFCLICNAKKECLYKMKLQTSAAAEDFRYLLSSLQISALQFREVKMPSPRPAPAPVTEDERFSSLLQTPPPVAVKAPEVSSEIVRSVEKTVVQTPESAETPTRPKTESEDDLVDVEADSAPGPALTIEAAADHMQGIVQQILTEITATGINVPENGVEEIESAAIANWMAQGFMKSETESDELKEELVELLRLLVRIKRKVQFRHRSKAAPISSTTFQDLQEIVEKPSKRIKYTTADIKELEVHAVSRQNKIKASGLAEIQKSSPTHDAVISGAGPEALVKEPAKPMGGLASSRWATSDGWSSSAAKPVVAAKSAAVPPPQAPTAVPNSQKPKTKGLSSSRWADKPVANEGKFAGF
ncbi:hypothetical protein TARUN_1038 [Trichoderma arundinaceum]|uniref:Uncharacterized protein n=1 Tax=Trichoderma arundinaceum TaxID=490622 RepID=A0A395NYM3_TRIAR|nr:hypothetical protein TARUN_1038 [Trichoderma arundinaceum]